MQPGEVILFVTHVESTPPACPMESVEFIGPKPGADLMKRTTKYVALDVHQDTTVASVREAGGRVLSRAVLPTEESAITKFFEGMRGPYM